jgi:hypothetical protein
MTLERYDPDRIDRLSLRVLDLCTRLRTLANRCRDEQLPPVELHDRKPQEWLDRLEDWLFQAEAEVNRRVHKHHGEQRARQTQSARPK